ncbi:YdeI/OmpD-associated family protein [Dokdonia sinensis]|uniref:YdeI/OmpD-associated family protein n=1 Tax=Dokdonia sinensis TaxID=2479847 RepID=UPI001374F360|nr:YdeI/OmpD-associated family protein [Dokdonia sinensis]
MLESKRIPVYIQGTHRIEIPDDIGNTFREAGHTRVAVTAYFEKNSFAFHGKLHKYKEEYVISFGKRYQKELGIFPSDFFEVQLREDTSTYGVEVPEAFQAVLDSDPDGASLFEQLTDGKKRSLIYFVKRIKREQTQVDKTLIIFENLKRGITDQRELVKPF